MMRAWRSDLGVEAVSKAEVASWKCKTCRDPHGWRLWGTGPLGKDPLPDLPPAEEGGDPIPQMRVYPICRRAHVWIGGHGVTMVTDFVPGEHRVGRIGMSFRSPKQEQNDTQKGLVLALDRLREGAVVSFECRDGMSDLPHPFEVLRMALDKGYEHFPLKLKRQLLKGAGEEIGDAIDQIFRRRISEAVQIDRVRHLKQKALAKVLQDSILPTGPTDDVTQDQDAKA